MGRVLANALLVAALCIPLGLYAGPRGSSHSSFSGSRAPFRSFAAAPRTRPVYQSTWSRTYGPPLHQPPVRPSSLINPGQASCVLNTSYSNSPYCRQYYPYGASFGFEPVYPYWMPSSGFETDQTAAPPPSPEPPPDTELADQVGFLAAQVQMMRQEQAQRDYRGSAIPPVAEPAPQPTVLVYRDGHQVEVQNYAIVGQTLWVFSDQATRRVPLTDLDLTSTQRVNAERGVDFVTPEPQ
jgi:hypothetical protein